MCAVWCVVLTCLASLCAAAANNTANFLPTTVRAESCIQNTTHCHCAYAPSRHGTCYKPASSPGTCTKGTCAAGFRCDCNADTICEKVSAMSYAPSSSSSADTFQCTATSVQVPRSIVATTFDFFVAAREEFQLFVNDAEVGFAVGSAPYQTYTAQIESGDVVAISARSSGAEKGIKLRFVDLRNETRSIDENWYASTELSAGWLSSEFDPAALAWTAPEVSRTVSGASFDANIPWMWLANAETVYMRYQIP